MMTLHPKVMDLVLDRVWRLLDRLDNPQDRLPPVIHVAGTNGKGSTCAFTTAILQAAGYRVHAYLKPHLVRFNERICLAGTEISSPDLAELLAEVEAANDHQLITYFEITTVAALLAFSRVPADALVLETGLGGRLDATNVVTRPAVTAITPVSLDHMAYLGDTVAAIAGEKAGILKAQSPAVIARQSAEAMAVIRRRAEEIAAPLFVAGQDWQAVRSLTAQGPRLIYRGRRWRFDLPPPVLPGAHQFENAGHAIAICEATSLFDRVDESAIRQGLASARLQARLQRLRTGPLVDALPAGWELWLDGGHNPAAGLALAGQALAWSLETPTLPLHVIAGMINSHDAAGFLAPLAPHLASLQTVAVPGEANAWPADTLASIGRDAGANAMSAPDVATALNQIVADADMAKGGGANRPSGGRILICGSLYLAGAVLRDNG
ncbi:MAG: folylpolyglutamate synthase/dihydrofolate synthase family protein [Alphaproteobacteria bacterium]